MKNKYISFSCIKCKNEITIKNNSGLNSYCPECYVMIDKIFFLLNENTKDNSKKENIIQKIDFYYDVKPIYELKVYSNLNQLLNQSVLPLYSNSLNISKNDLKQIFKDSKSIKQLTLDLKSFNELDIDKIKFRNIAIVVYCSKKDNTLFFMGDIINNFNKKLALNTQLAYGIVFEDSMSDEQIIDVIYD